MRRFRLMVGVVSLAAAASAAASAGPATAQPSSAADAVRPNMPEEALAEYREMYPDVPLATLYKRIYLQSAQFDLLGQFGTAYDSTFAGSNYDLRANLWHLYATTAATADAMAATARAAGQTVQTRVVRHSLRDLVKRADRIRSGQDKLSAVSTMAGVDIDANLVKVAAPAARRTVRDPMVKYVDVPKGRPVDQACTNRRNCGAPMRTGIILWHDEPNNAEEPHCSLGFVALGSDGTRWAYTAGHCVDVAAERWGHGGQYIGNAGACAVTTTPKPGSGCYLRTGTDMVRIRITNSYWLAGGFGYIFANPDPTSLPTVDIDDAQYTITQIATGQVVCLHAWHKNYNTGWVASDPPDYKVVSGDTCGHIEDPMSVTYGMPTVTGAVVCAGDSGGGWVLYPAAGGRVAYGLHKNGSSDQYHTDPYCTDGTKAWFTPLSAVNDFMDWYSATTIRVITR